MKKLIFTLLISFFSCTLALNAQNSGNKPDNPQNILSQQIVKPGTQLTKQKMVRKYSSKIYKNVGVLKTAPVVVDDKLKSIQKVNIIKPNETNLAVHLTFEESLQAMSLEQRNNTLQELTLRLSQVEAGSPEHQKLIKITTLLKGLK